MSNLISRDKLIDEIERDIDFKRESDIPLTAIDAFKIAIRRAKELRSVDTEPVRHGRWIEYTYWIGSFGQIHTKCSECGTDYPSRKGSRGDGKGGKYCEECGAKMDLEE